jgi:hypothetical protein
MEHILKQIMHTLVCWLIDLLFILIVYGIVTHGTYEQLGIGSVISFHSIECPYIWLDDIIKYMITVH